MGKSKNEFLYKEMNVVFVYLLIAVVGFIIVFCMTNFLNNKVNEFTDNALTQNNK